MGFSRHGMAVAALVLLLPIGAARGAEPEPCFTPGDDCTGVILREIGRAGSAIMVQAYLFTSTPIARALLDAHKRGVKVTAVLDASNGTDRYTAADFLANQGIRTLLDGEHNIAHNKVIVIDRAVVITGSFNFTRSAQDANAENLIVLRSKPVAEAYARNVEAHIAHSRPYEGRGARGSAPDRPWARGQRDWSQRDWSQRDGWPRDRSREPRELQR